MTASAGLRKRAAKIRTFPETEIKKHSTVLRSQLIASARAATGGDGAYSGLGNKPKLGVSARMIVGGQTASVTLKPSPKGAAGPWRWADEGTKAGKRSVGGRRRGSYFHPGTRGRDAWSDPVRRELPRIRTDIRSAFAALNR